MTTPFIDPDRIAAGRRAKIEEALESSEAMEDALLTVTGSVTAYENQFRRFLKTVVATSEVEGLTYEALAAALADDNEAALADGQKPPHRYTSAGSLSTLEAVGQLEAMGGDLPEGYVWRRPSDSAPLLKGERSVTDIVWKIISPGTKSQALLRQWADHNKIDVSTLYGKRVVMNAIRTSVDLAEAVQRLNDYQAAIAKALQGAKALGASEAAGGTTEETVEDRWARSLKTIEHHLEKMREWVTAGELPSSPPTGRLGGIATKADEVRYSIPS